MKKKPMSLKKKVTFTQTGLAIILLCILSIFIYNKAYDNYVSAVQSEMKNLSEVYSGKISHIFKGVADNLNGLSASFTILKKDGANRKIISDTLKAILENNHEYLKIWTCWEPNAFDNKDTEYIGSKFHDNTGRVVYSWSKAGGIHGKALVGYKSPNSKYAIARDTGKIYTTDVHNVNEAGTTYNIVSFAKPILSNGRVIGVVGIDLDLNKIHEITHSIKPYNAGYAFLMSNNGTIISHKKESNIGKNIASVHKEVKDELETKIPKGESFVYKRYSSSLKSDSVYFHVPVSLVTKNNPWSLGISVPTKVTRASLYKMRNYMILLVIVFAIIIALVTYFMINKAFGPIIKLKDMMQDAAQGEADLTKRMEIATLDEIGETAQWFNIFIERMQKLINNVKQNSQSVSSAALEISSSTEELSATVEEQSVQAQSVSTSLNELSTTSNEIASSMEKTREVTDESSQLTNEGSKIIENSIDSLKEIEKQSKNLNVLVEDLGESSKKIGNIVQVINDVADQTNLLALNAAIEAARAGEQGRGFAVVADEVRKLAERTAKATDEIVLIIKDLQDKSNKASQAMTETVNEVIQGREHGENSLEILGKIVNSGSEVKHAADSIAAAVEQENATIGEISNNLQEMVAGSQESASAVQEVASTADNLAREADNLKTLVDQFITEK